MAKEIVTSIEEFKHLYSLKKDFHILLNPSSDLYEKLSNKKATEWLSRDGTHDIPTLIENARLFVEAPDVKTVYHASPIEFDFPCYESIIKNRTNHINGHLGLWCAPENKWISGFGHYIYEVKYKSDSILKMSFHDFKNSCDRELNKEQDDAFQLWRQKLINDGFSVLEIVENNGQMDMLIILDLNAIISFNKYNN